MIEVDRRQLSTRVDHLRTSRCAGSLPSTRGHSTTEAESVFLFSFGT